MIRLIWDRKKWLRLLLVNGQMVMNTKLLIAVSYSFFGRVTLNSDFISEFRMAYTISIHNTKSVLTKQPTCYKINPTLVENGTRPPLPHWVQSTTDLADGGPQPSNVDDMSILQCLLSLLAYIIFFLVFKWTPPVRHAQESINCFTSCRYVELEVKKHKTQIMYYPF